MQPGDTPAAHLVLQLLQLLLITGDGQHQPVPGLLQVRALMAHYVAQ